MSNTYWHSNEQYTLCVEKKSLQDSAGLHNSMCNFNKFKDIFIIFGTNHPETPPY